MTSDPIHELTETTDRDRRLLKTIEAELTDTSRKVGNQLTDLEDKVKALQTKLVTTDTQLGKTDTQLRKEAAKVAQLRLSVVALDRKVRVSGGLPRADFDTWQPAISPEMIELIRTRLASAPPSEAQIHQLHKKHEEAQEERARWNESLRTALQAARALTDLSPASERAWRRESRTWFSFHKIGPRRDLAEERARRQHDEAVRAQKSARVAAARAEEADDAACATIRERVANAVAQDMVLPWWFDSALGLYAPADPDKIRPWLAAATKLIRYRLLAGVRDPVHSFGDRPPDEALAHEFDQVVLRCSELRP